MINFLKCYRYQLSRTVKGLRFYCTCKLTCHSFIDDGGRHETPKSETKDIIAHFIRSSMNSICVSLFSAPNPIGVM